jgi:nucleoside-diphosphate-sugar epimerase
VSWHQADIARTQQALGWRPRIDLERSAKDQWSALTADDPRLGKATAGRSRAA